MHLPSAVADPLELRISFLTLAKLVFFALLVLVIIKLWTVIIMLVIAALLAVVLDPLVLWLIARGMRRGFAIGLVALLVFAVVGAFLFTVIPATLSQLQELGKTLPKTLADAAQEYPRFRPLIAKITALANQPLKGIQMQQWFTRGLIAGRFAIEGLTGLVLTLVTTIYLLVEGRRVLEWLLAFAHGRTRDRLRRTLDEVQPIVFAYMRGQAITCFLCGGVALTTLTLLHIPAAVALAVVAFIADLVPVVGTIIMTVPAVALALVVSPLKALVVVAVYLSYHLVESYLIIPRVYGAEMKLSTLTVLLAVIVGGTLQGAVGAVLILPFVAAYPVVERIWLKAQLGETVAEHRQIETAE
jgi:predicted PurR-regulated permease PerM